MAKEKRPNILLIYTDQHRADALSCAGGYPGLTPNIDRLAGDGVRFTNAYAPSPVCGPARASLFTGRFCGDNGVILNWRPFKEGMVTLPEKLQGAGYRTFLSGKLHFMPHAKAFGFDVKHLNDAPYSVYSEDAKHSAYIDFLKAQHFQTEDVVGLFDADELAIENDDMARFILGSGFRTQAQHDIPWTADRAMDFIDNEPHEAPFFMNVSFFGPHQPYEAPAPYDRYDGPVTLPTNLYADMTGHPVFMKLCTHFKDKLAGLSEGDHLRFIRSYLGQVQMIDAYIGQIIERLKVKGLYEDTLIMVTSDHGDYLGAYGLYFKGQMYDPSAKVPFIVKPAGAHACGEVSDVISAMDLYGTLLEAAGVENDSRDARSLMPYMTNIAYQGPDEARSVIFGEGYIHTMLRCGPLKLMKVMAGEEALYELYDLTADADEVRDLWPEVLAAGGSMSLKAEVEGMKRRLDIFTNQQYSAALEVR